MTVNCPFCQSNQTTFIFSTYDLLQQTWSVYKCQQCRYYFLDPSPTAEQLEQSYQQEYYGKGNKKFSFPLLENFINIHRKHRANLLFKSINKKVQASILDIGCGNGQFLTYLYEKGIRNLYGIELPGNSAQRAAQKPFIKLHVGDVYSVQFDEKMFDAITLFHVFEHLSKPDETLSLIVQWLKDDGFLVVSFPNITSRQARWSKGHWLHLDPPRHLNFIEPNDFILKMQTLGFRLLKTKYMSLEQNPFGYIQSILNKWSSKRELLFEAFKGNKSYTQSASNVLWLHFLFFAISLPFFVLLDIIDSMNQQSGTVLFIFKKDMLCKKDAN